MKANMNASVALARDIHLLSIDLHTNKMIIIRRTLFSGLC